MAPTHFLDLPMIVREQIYAELLVQPQSEDLELGSPSEYCMDQVPDYTKHPKDVFTSIMYANRQIYDESSNTFHSRNLFILVNLHNYRYDQSPDSVIAMIHKLCFCTFINLTNEPPNSRFGMSIDLYTINRPPPDEEFVRPAFVFSAHTLPQFIMCIAGAPASNLGVFDSQVLNMHEIILKTQKPLVVAKFRIHNTFGYSLDQFSQRMFAKIMAAKPFPDFAAMSFHGPMDSECIKQLIKKLPPLQETFWDQFAVIFEAQQSQMMSSSADLDDADIQLEIERLNQFLNCVDIIWDFLSYRGFRHECDQTWLFHCTADVWGMIVLAQLIRATQYDGDPEGFYILARQAAEEGISYLNQEKRFINHSNFESVPQPLRGACVNMVNRAKAQLSLKAYKACTKLMVRTAAKRYIINAQSCDPHMYPNSQELLLKLAFKEMDDDPLPDDPLNDHNWPAVLWRTWKAPTYNE